jgi:hypothetical protein
MVWPRRWWKAVKEQALLSIQTPSTISLEPTHIVQSWSLAGITQFPKNVYVYVCIYIYIYIYIYLYICCVSTTYSTYNACAGFTLHVWHTIYLSLSISLYIYTYTYRLWSI